MKKENKRLVIWFIVLFVLLVLGLLVRFFIIDTQNKKCVGEGGSTAPEPNVKDNIGSRCCEDLTPITHIKEEDGEWFTLAGSSFCTKCGDGICKKPENIKNCLIDCEGVVIED